MSTTVQAPPRRRVVVAPKIGAGRWMFMTKVLLIWMASAAVHAGMIFGFYLVLRYLPLGPAQGGETDAAPDATVAQIDQPDDSNDLDLTNPDLGTDTTQQTNFDVSRIEDVSVPGPVDATQAVGVLNAPDAMRQTVSAPPGIGGGQGGGVPSMDTSGAGALFGTPGGYAGGLMMAGSFGGRSGATRKQMLSAGGGNAVSEAAVARGLKWLAHHQAPDGHWSLDHFELFAHDDNGKYQRCSCTGQVANRTDDIAATGFGLLPFLGAGQTQKPNKEANQIDYSKNVKTGLEYLMKKQGADGYFGGSMYSHGIATIAICEAYGMTSDPDLKAHAQKAIRFIETAQDPGGGGWRYSPKTPGDLSVTGWEVMALKSAQMAGLELYKDPGASKPRSLALAEKFLDSVESSNKGGYSYMPGNPETVVMTAVGMLCREYMGVGPRNPGLLAGVDRLKSVPPGKANNMYYEYYATQVMHHMQGDAWDYWNEGPGGKDSHTGVRDALIAKQCTIADKVGLPNATPPLTAALGHEDGSWDPSGAWGAEGGGRIMYTSLSLLTLEVYYRHLPLYRRDMGGQK
jgi:hypothetical protein